MGVPALLLEMPTIEEVSRPAATSELIDADLAVLKRLTRSCNDGTCLCNNARLRAKKIACCRHNNGLLTENIRRLEYFRYVANMWQRNYLDDGGVACGEAPDFTRIGDLPCDDGKSSDISSYRAFPPVLTLFPLICCYVPRESWWFSSLCRCFLNYKGRFLAFVLTPVRLRKQHLFTLQSAHDSKPYRQEY